MNLEKLIIQFLGFFIGSVITILIFYFAIEVLKGLIK